MLLLDEEKVSKLSESKRTLTVLQWLQELPQFLSTIDKNELKIHQRSLIQQLHQYGLHGSLSPPLRILLASSFISLYSSGDTSTVYDTIAKCIDLLRVKDESGTHVANNKFTSIVCLGAIFEHLGRMAGGLFLDVVQALLKAAKITELRSHICQTLGSIIKGLGSSSLSIHKDIYKFLRSSLTDKQLSVRVSSANCVLELAQINPIYYTAELDSLSQICLKALEGSDYNTRCAVGQMWGSLLAMSQKPLPPHFKGKQVKVLTLEDVLSLLSQGFVRGSGGFLKAGGPELLQKNVSASTDVRVGVTQTYVYFITSLGGKWLERHLSIICQNVLDLLSNPKATSTHIDSVYTRKCIQFILRSVFGKLLNEASQLAAGTHLCQVIRQLTSAGGTNIKSNEGGVAGDSEEATKSSSVAKQHMVICAVSEVSSLIRGLNTAAIPLVVEDSGSVGGETPAPLIEALNGVLVNPSLATRLAGARCMFQVGLALPSQLTSLINYLLIKCKINRGHPMGLVGYSYALSALLTTGRLNKLGVPLKKAEEIYDMGYELAQIPQDKGNLSVASIQSGWALIGAFLTLGSPYVQSKFRPTLELWYKLFPHSHKELLDEMSSGTSSSWKHTFETRIGALTALTGFLSSCGPELLSDNVIKKIMLPLDSVLALVSKLPGLIKTYGVQLKALSAMIRLRLYQNFILLPPTSYEGCLNAIIREVVAEFTMSETMSNTITSLLRSMCHRDDSVLLGTWLEETDHKDVEEMLQANSAAGSGSMEHDPASTYIPSTHNIDFSNPLPLGVAVIDASITLFGQVFPVLSSKHQLQLLTHFKECIKQSKTSQQQPIQINIITAVLSGLKGLVEAKSSFNQDELVSSAYSLISGALSSNNAVLRCAAGEALGRLSQVVGNVGFVGQIVQMSVDAIKSSKGASTGHLLTLGCLHRYVGGMSAGQHLSVSVSVLQEITSTNGSPISQVWSLHALTLIADSGGPLFRNHVDSTLSLLLSILLQTSLMQTDIYRCLGNCLSALLTTLGPELQIESQSMSLTRKTCLTACAIIEKHPDPVVQASAISCIQQLQLFAPKLVGMPTIVPRLYASLDSSHLLLRRSAANSLRQFSQQEPRIVWQLLASEEGGLEHTVLSKLDTETDEKLRFDLKEILFSLLSALAPSDPMKWLLLCNGVLSASNQSDTTNEGAVPIETTKQDDDEDLAKFTTGVGDDMSSPTVITPRWPTKVFAVECSRKIYTVCKSDPAHFDLSLAEEKKRNEGGDYLVMHLSELVRTSFIAATASVDELKLAGYQALQDVIQLFACTIDPEYKGHVLLEQYQAQHIGLLGGAKIAPPSNTSHIATIGAALRPAFTSEATPHVTAMACQVCSEWLGSGVSRHIGDLKRVQQLLIMSLDKLQKGQSSDDSIYGERVATMESLAVLKAWAELYIKVSVDDVSRRQGTPDPGNDQANDLINPHLHLLSQYWTSAIRDHAYLSLPGQFGSQLPPNGGTFYSFAMSSFVHVYYQSNWPSILRAASLWASRCGFNKKNHTSSTDNLSSDAPPPFASMMAGVAPPIAPPTDERHDMFYLFVGVAVQALCDPSMYETPHTIQCCLHSLHYLVQTKLAKDILVMDTQLLLELLNVLHRVLLTSNSIDIHLMAFKIAHTLTTDLQLQSLEEQLEENKSCAYTLLVLSSWILLKQSPDHQLLSIAVQLLPNVVQWTSPQALNSILPCIIYMLVTATATLQDTPLFSVCLKSWQRLCALLSDPSIPILQSAMKSLLVSDDSITVDMFISTRLMLLSVLLIVDYSKEVCHPASQLFEECVEFFKTCLTSKDSNVQIKCLQICRSLFSSSLGVEFIHPLGPVIVNSMQTDVQDIDILNQSVQLLEMLLELTPDDKKSIMLGLLIPLLISLLSDHQESLKQHPQDKQDSLIQKLTSIGRRYPQQFKTIMTPELKSILERAIKSSAQQKNGNKVAGQPSSAKQQPSITLTMDFSKFK